MGSKHLNNPEYMDDADSAEVKMVKLEKSKEELELFESLKHKSMLIKEDNHKVVIFVEASDRASIKPFMSNYMSEEILEKLGFVRIDFRDPSIVFGRNFLVTTKSKVDFGIGEIRVDLTKLKEDEDMGIFLDELDDIMEEVGSTSGEMVKMGKANRNKNYSVNKLTPPSLKIEEIPPSSSVSPSPIYRPLTQKQKEKIKEVLDQKYKELEEPKPILEVLDNYVVYKKKLDEVLMGTERLSNKDFSEKVKVGIIEHGLPKKMSDPRNYVLPVKVIGVVEMVALAETRASVSVLPYSLYQNIGLGNPMPYHSNLTMADNTQAKAMGEVRNVRNQIGTMSIDDGVICHTYLPNPKVKTILDNLEKEEDEDWLGCFEVGRDEDGYPSSLPVQLKNTDWGNDGHGLYKKIERDGAWHAKFEIITPSGRMFTRATKNTPSNPLIAKYEKRNRVGMVEYALRPVTNANLKLKDLPSVERHAYCEKLSKLQLQNIGTPRVADWSMFYVYSFDETLKEMMKKEYIHEDGDILVDYSWERALSIEGDVYSEWCLDFFSILYFEKDVDRNNLMNEKCIWFRLCGKEHVLTLPELAVCLRFYTHSELEHRSFVIHFSKLEIDDGEFDYDGYWNNIGRPTSTNPRQSLFHEPLMRIIHKLIVVSLIHRTGSKEIEIEKCSEPIECEKWTTRMLAGELDVDENKLLGSTELPMPEVRGQEQETSELNSSWGDWNAHLDEIQRDFGTSSVPSFGYDVGGFSRGHDDDDHAIED
ncbi:retrovirus-related pol polyprotein from transposon TNT 1-94 [Tanacetum coccineum]